MHIRVRADVAELVDAQVSEACGSNLVEVRFFSSAPKNLQMKRNAFISAIKTHESAFDLNLADEKISALADYFQLVQKHNVLLHLVGPCSEEEFAVRHILESLFLLRYLPKNSSFADVGAGAGLPSLPCLIVREDLRANLIESKIKKADFLSNAISELQLEKRARIINKRFEETTAPNVQIVTTRALEKLPEKLSELIRWSGKKRLVIFSGNAVCDKLTSLKVSFTQQLIPLSERRFVIDIER